MFVWTPENVLAAIDAGIPEVIAIYNRAHAQVNVHGLGLHRNRTVGLTPYFHPRIAFAVAMDQTVATLNWVEGLAIFAPQPDSIPTVAEGRFLDALFG